MDQQTWRLLWSVFGLKLPELLYFRRGWGEGGCDEDGGFK